LLELDIHPKLVQYIKLAEAEAGLGTEYVRAPRLTLVGEERERVLALSAKDWLPGPSLPEYLSLAV
jgi:dihydrodipicolinate synthase/N-acetylneuraminate lyase